MSENITKHVSPILQQFIVKYEDFKIGKMIGQGAFGKVYYAVHLPTKKKCAVKKLFMKELTGQDMISFCREIEVLVKCDNVFVLPFFGWSATFPYIIVTQYIPNGSLFNALHHRPLAPQLSATNKTLIAIGIASGMQSLHSVGIIHRDLKSLNILLDETILPKICDFGLSRFQDDEISQMTADIGTPHWMAPELFESNKYTNKVDVYAFGMLMWEMYNEVAPFQGMNGVQIAFQVSKEGYRPSWPDSTPKKFKSFVKKCWHQNPEKRPTFSQIFRAFMQKMIYFPGTDLDFVDRLRADITADERRRLKNADNRVPPLFVPKARTVSRRKPPPALDQSPRSPSHNRRKSRQDGWELSGFEPLPKPTSPKFAEQFTRTINYITRDNISDFFKMIVPYFSNNTVPDDIMILILKELHKILSNVDNLSVFIDLDYHNMLPIQKVSVSNLTLLLLLHITTSKPDVVNIRFMHFLEPAIVKYPAKVLTIISPFLLKFNMVQGSWEIVDFLIKNCEPFLLGAGDMFIHTLYFLCTTFDTVINARFNYIVNIINFALTIHDVNTVRNSYKFATRFYTERFSVSPKTMISHIGDPELRTYALSFLVKQIHVEVTLSLIQALICASPYEKVAIGMLNNFLSSSLEVCKLFMQIGSSWMFSASLEMEEVLGFILILASYPTLRAPLSVIPELADVLSSLVETEQEEFVDIVVHLIVKLMPSPKLITNLAETGFFTKFLNIVDRLDNEVLINEALFLIDTLSKVSYVPDFINAIPYIVNLVSNSQFESASFSALAAMSTHPKLANEIKKISMKLLRGSHSSRTQPYLRQLTQNLGSM
ncbi:TKL family protein kinase [Tritrichomonas foetus]|uniref:TKL family protein kinase n=1 Tax=Tritrichomonas foetus TaxID=1144522 RepID=A0A1J4J477_9EUKA|nr:TKL family protein kinase [Tritrichomonas foetus]|eukprot:OHS94198.1 TKL family protein kinase [Tritrichomonas foetus]